MADDAHPCRGIELFSRNVLCLIYARWALCVITQRCVQIRRAFMRRMPEPSSLCDVMADTSDGGILGHTGVIDVFNCMRRIDEQSFGGGVFVIVDTENDASWEVLAEKGICVSTDGRRGLLYNPLSSFGLEAPISIMSTVWLDQPTGSQHIGHHVDLHAVAARDRQAGEVLAITDHHHHEIAGLTPQLRDATKIGTSGALPYYMAAENRLVCDVRQADNHSRYGRAARRPNSLAITRRDGACL